MKAKILLRILHFLGCVFLIISFTVACLTINHWMEILLPWTVQ